MFQYFNQNSLLVIVILIGITLFFFPIKKIKTKLFVISSFIFFIFVFFNYYMSAPDVINHENSSEIIFSGEPTLIEYYSDTWLGCVLSDPILNRVEKKFGDKIKILRIDARDSNNSKYIQEFKFFATPSFVLLDGQGIIIWRQDVSVLDYDSIKIFLEDL